MATGVASIPLPGVPFGPGGASPRPLAAVALRAFHAGPENLLLRVAAESLLDPQRPPFTPLLLLGPSGVGKTHLAHGLARRWTETLCEGKVVCLTGGEFAKTFAEAIDGDTVRNFRRQMRTARLFVLDDLTALTKKPAALKELLFTLDALEQSGAAAVVTSRLAPGEQPQLPPALVSRLIGGLVITLSPPGCEARRAILEELANSAGLTLSPTAAETLADEVTASVPELLQVLLRISRGESNIDAQRAQQFLSDRGAQQQPTMSAIVAVTAKQFSLKISMLKSASRNRTVVSARSVAMYLARKLTSQSLEQIGRAFGNRDHSTVLHNCRKIEKLLKTDPATRQTVAQLQKLLSR